jgi:hypothetical protein
VTIDTFFEVSCDGCGDTHHEDTFSTKSDVWEHLKKHGWKRRKEILWCPECVKSGLYKRKYIDWADESKS